MELIAHRGASFDAPENTLAAFRMAFEQGADACELDIHLSQDGQIVVIHDYTTWRVAGVDKAIREQTLSELKLLDAGSWKDRQWTGEPIPTLSEVLEMLPGGKRLFIEIKCGAEVLPELERTLNNAGKEPAQIALIGFSYDTIRKAKEWFPSLEAYWLRAFPPEQIGGNPRQLTDPLIEQSLNADLNGLNLLFNGPLDQQFVSKAHALRQRVYVWTVDDPAEAQRLIEFGIDGLSTNRPAFLRQHIGALLAQR